MNLKKVKTILQLFLIKGGSFFKHWKLKWGWFITFTMTQNNSTGTSFKSVTKVNFTIFRFPKVISKHFSEPYYPTIS